MTIQVYPAAKSQVTSNFWRYTAVGGETTLTGVDSTGTSLYYYPNQEQVFLNGVLLVRGVDYTAISGTSITGLAALVAGDTVQVNCYSNFTITQVPVTSLQGSITNLQLANSSITIGGQTINLGGSQSTFSGITLTAPTLNNAIVSTTATGAAPLTINGIASQTGDMFDVKNSSGTVIDKIDANGNLGINTSTLTTANNYGSITIGGSSGTLLSSIINGTETFRIQPTSGVTTINQIANTPLVFNTNNTEVARFTGSGLFGVNNSNPSAQLDVGGSINSTNFYMSGKNFAVNGGFDYWQRGITFSNAGYTADKWLSFGNDNVTRQSFTVASPEIPNGIYYLRFQPAQSGAYHAVENRIENGHNDLSGKTITVSFWARSNTSNNFNMNVLSNLNNDTQGFVLTAALTPTWTKYSVTATLPALNYAAAYRYIRFNTPDNSLTYGFDLAQVQYEIGTAATPFSRTGGTLAGEIRECERFYYQTPTYVTASYSAYNTGNMITTPFFFPTRMRIAPIITVSDSAGTANKITIYPSGGNVATGITPAGTTTITSDYWYYQQGGTSSGSQGSSGLISLYYYASADL